MQTKLNVKEVSCSHCASAIKQALLELSGVTGVEVDLKSKTVTVYHDESAEPHSITTTIEEQGYDVM